MAQIFGTPRQVVQLQLEKIVGRTYCLVKVYQTSNVFFRFIIQEIELSMIFIQKFEEGFFLLITWEVNRNMVLKKSSHRKDCAICSI